MRAAKAAGVEGGRRLAGTAEAAGAIVAVPDIREACWRAIEKAGGCGCFCLEAWTTVGARRAEAPRTTAKVFGLRVPTLMLQPKKLYANLRHGI